MISSTSQTTHTGTTIPIDCIETNLYKSLFFSSCEIRQMELRIFRIKNFGPTAVPALPPQELQGRGCGRSAAVGASIAEYEMAHCGRCLVPGAVPVGSFLGPRLKPHSVGQGGQGTCWTSWCQGCYISGVFPGRFQVWQAHLTQFSSQIWEFFSKNRGILW